MVTKNFILKWKQLKLNGSGIAYTEVYWNIFLLYKTNRFHSAVGLFSYRSQKTSKCGIKKSELGSQWGGGFYG